MLDIIHVKREIHRGYSVLCLCILYVLSNATPYSDISRVALVRYVPKVRVQCKELGVQTVALRNHTGQLQ